MRDHEAAAASVGINLARTKVLAFALSALYAGIAGSISVLVLSLANAGKVETFQLSIEFLVAVVIGGTATVVGPAHRRDSLSSYIDKWTKRRVSRASRVAVARDLRHPLIVLDVRAARRHRRRRTQARGGSHAVGCRQVGAIPRRHLLST